MARTLAALLAASLVAAGLASAALPQPASPLPGFTLVEAGIAGGAVWQGPIPNLELPSDHRLGAVYLPPGYDPGERYPVVYLLHGLRGSPSSFYDSLRIADVADGLIASGKAAPFIAVMPYGGPVVHPEQGEWAGVWARYVVDDVVPWTDANLPTLPDRADRTLAGLSAGGFGALDIGLRHPDVFGTLESWAGYFHPFHDGPFVHASRRLLDANDPTLLVQKDAAELRATGTRFFISTGYGHGSIPESAAFDYGALLGKLGLTHTVWLLPRTQLHHFWSAQLPFALAYAVPPR
jgi:S-formylglutathione hydrolase FrmB